MNDIQIFNNKEFGQVRAIEVNGEPYFVANDVARALGYSNPSKATNDHCKKSIMRRGNDSLGRQQEFKVIPEGDIYRLIVKSQLPSAEKFETWVFDEVLPSIRKTGSYTVKTTDKDSIKLMNARSRMANTYLRLAKIDTLSSEYKNILVSKASQVLAGEEIIPLPKLTQRTMTADAIGKELGISSNMVGRLANKNNLKQEGVYGEYRRDKSRYSSKEVDTFVYYPCALDKFKEFI